MYSSELITPQHLARKAVIYIRQSTPHQVLSHQESLRLQYALHDRARQLGWPDEAIAIIDDDLGLTAASAAHREGFNTLIAQVTLEQVGLILSYDVTRLSRNCSDWYPLLDLCGYKGCLIADSDGVYDPATVNGRLLLGLKGTLSERERHTMQARLTAGLIHKAQRYLAYLLIAALTIFTIGVIVLRPFTAADFDLGTFNRNAFLVQFFAAATYQLSWAIYVSDYSRYLPPTVGVRASFWWTFLGAWIGGFWMMLVGTVAASMFNLDNVVLSVIQAGDAIFGGFGTILIVLAFLGLLTITGLNFYGASLTLLSAYDSIKPLKATLNTRIVALVVVAVSATTIAYLASGNFITTFGTFIHFLGLLFAPWTAINLIDFYFVRKTHYSIRAIFEPHGGIYGRWNWRGLLAYGLGFLSMIPFTASAHYQGTFAKALGGADISMIVGLLVGGAVYLLAYRSFDLEAERLAVDKADVGLDPDAPNGIPYAAVPHGKRK